MYLSQLTLKDREWLEKLLKQGYTLKEIAKRMGRSYSCIRVEVKKSGGKVHYNATMAQHLSDSRRTSWRNGDA